VSWPALHCAAGRLLTSSARAEQVRKVRKIGDGKAIAGFAGEAALGAGAFAAVLSCLWQLTTAPTPQVPLQTHSRSSSGWRCSWRRTQVRASLGGAHCGSALALQLPVTPGDLSHPTASAPARRPAHASGRRAGQALADRQVPEAPRRARPPLSPALPRQRLCCVLAASMRAPREPASCQGYDTLPVRGGGP